MSGLLDGKRVLVTGVVNRHSIAYAIAEGAQREGAEVLLTSFGRVRRMTERAARNLDPVPDVLELDVDFDEDLASARSGRSPSAGARSTASFTRSHSRRPTHWAASSSTRRARARCARSRPAPTRLARCVAALDPLLAERNGSGAGASVVGLDFDASVAWPAYDWMGVAKAGLESVSRYLARDLGSEGRPRQPRLGRPGRHPGGRRDPRLRPARPRTGATRRRLAGTSATRAQSPTPSSSSSQTSREPSAARSSTRTAEPTRLARAFRPPPD